MLYSNKPFLAALVLVGLLLCTTCKIEAQNEIDVARYSRYGVGGTARAQSLGGAMTAVGGDWSAATLNPAGLGIYSASELHLSMALQYANTQAKYLGETSRTPDFNFTLPSFGLVINSRTKNTGSLSSVTFGFGFNQQMNLRRSLDVEGFNTKHSLTTAFAQQATQEASTLNLSPSRLYGFEGPYAPFDNTAMGYNTFFSHINPNRDTLYTGLINPYRPDDVNYWDNTLPGDRSYFGAFDFGKVNQRVQHTERGRINDWAISLAGNWEERLFIGATLGIQDITFRQDRTIIETDNTNFYQNSTLYDIRPVQSIEYNEELRTTGSGINARIGAIYQPLDYFRFGVSIVTPTWLSLTDKFTTSQTINSDFRTGSRQVSDNGMFDYNMTTPYRANFGVMGIFPKLGFISADVELVDYSSASLSSRDDRGLFRNANRTVQNTFRNAYNYRVGAEVRKDALYARVGLAAFQPIYTDEALSYIEVNSGAKNTLPNFDFTYTGGLGYRDDSYFLDFGFVLQQMNDRSFVYTLVDRSAVSPVLATRRNLTNFIVSAGVRF